MTSGSNPTRLAVPRESGGWAWKEVSYRLIIGWVQAKPTAVSGASSDDPLPARLGDRASRKTL